MLISDEDMRALARVEGVREVALGDCILAYDDSEPFVTFLKRIRPEKPHWFAAPAADTPDEAALYSVEAQSRYARAHSTEELISLLKANGLTPGKVLKAAPVDPADKIKGSNNPYDDACKLSLAEKEKRIASLIKQGGTGLAARLAKAAGKTITGQPLQQVGVRR